MHQHPQSVTNTLTLLLNKIKRYYSITQKKFNYPPTLSRRHISLSEETVNELSGKILRVNEEIKSFIKSLSDKRDIYTKQRNAVLSKNSRSDIISQALTMLSSDLYNDLVLVSKCFCGNELNDPIWLNAMGKINKIANDFELALGRLSDDIFSLKIKSSAFSLTRLADLLSMKYERNYEDRYNRNGFFSLGILYTIKKYLRTSTRAEEIDFLSNKISLHPSCNDIIRYNAFLVVIHKIDDCNPKNSILRDILMTGQCCAFLPEHEHIPPYEMLDSFCSKHHIKKPNSLLSYMNNKRDSPEENRFLINQTSTYF